MLEEHNTRLNGWKQIARYLGRDRRTAMRWEVQAGMPVHRIPGSSTGRSVYAFTRELDAWLSHRRPEPEEDGAEPTTSTYRISQSPRLVVGVALLGLLAVALLQRSEGADQGPSVILVEGVNDQLLARDQTGRLTWSYQHPDGHVFAKSQASTFVDLDGDGQKEVVLAANTLEVSNQSTLQGELLTFSGEGALRWRRILRDTLHFAARSFEGPWTSEAFDVLSINGEARIVWAVHHYRWWPSIVEVIDAAGDVAGRFVNAGWVLASHVLERPDGDQVLLGGISNSRGGAMLAVLDGRSVWGTSPEDEGGGFECSDCPEGDPLIYFLFPPSHVNSASGLPYNRTARVEATGTGVRAIVIEGEPNSGVHRIYEFSHDLELIRVTPGDTYWPAHRLLRLQGKIDHTEEECSERLGIPIRRWTSAAGWVEVGAEDAPALLPGQPPVASGNELLSVRPATDPS